MSNIPKDVHHRIKAASDMYEQLKNIVNNRSKIFDLSLYTAGYAFSSKDHIPMDKHSGAGFWWDGRIEAYKIRFFIYKKDDDHYFIGDSYSFSFGDHILFTNKPDYWCVSIPDDWIEKSKSWIIK